MRRRAVGLFFICTAVVPLAIVSTAWACGVLASVKVAPGSVAPGGTVTVTGVNYSSSMATFTPVSLRLDSRTATPLATTTPVGGKINTTVQIPAGTSTGSHILLGTQNSLADGTPKSGTPGRTTLKVVVARSKGSSTPVPAWGGKPTGPTSGGAATVALDGGGSGNPALLTTLLGVLLSVTLLGTGMTLVRRSITANRTVLGA